MYVDPQGQSHGQHPSQQSSFYQLPPLLPPPGITTAPPTNAPSPSPTAPPAPSGRFGTPPAQTYVEPTIKVDVPSEPKLPPHPDAADAYDVERMRDFKVRTLQGLNKQRLWAFWLTTRVTPEAVARAQTEQHYANMVSSHCMLYAAVLDCIPDTSAMRTIRLHVQSAAVVPNCSIRDGVLALHRSWGSHRGGGVTPRDTGRVLVR